MNETLLVYSQLYTYMNQIAFFPKLKNKENAVFPVFCCKVIHRQHKRISVAGMARCLCLSVGAQPVQMNVRLMTAEAVRGCPHVITITCG